MDNRDVLEAFEFIQSHVDEYGHLHVDSQESGLGQEGEEEEEDQGQEEEESHECDNPNCSNFGPVMVTHTLLIDHLHVLLIFSHFTF